ncbi:MAG: LamG domain-containing protein [Candidatus Nitrosoabyssus spongiisocia]|nr:MAG: LamG domain-containing protein [Nitrosopumilaceae archaeon AB1(1)]
MSSTNDTILYMYYNVSSAATITHDNVWDSDYEIIYHMDQSTFGAQSTLDSSGNDCHATPLSTGAVDFNSNDLVSAQIGNGLNFDGVDKNNGDYLDLPDLAGSLFHNTDFTISVWANIDASKNWARIIDFGNGQDDNNILIAAPRTSTDLRYDMRQDTSPAGITASNVLQIGQWAYFTVVHESSGTATIYKNGASITSDTVHTSLNESRASNYIGRSNWESNSYFDGKFDEFRLSSTARSADWIATEYANQNSPSTFFTISAPEDRRVAITSAITNTQGDNIIITFNKNIIYSVIPTTDFALTGTSATIDSITSNSSSITLNLSRNLLLNETITISYTKTSGGINSTQSIKTTLENFVNQPITNNVPLPPIFVNAYTNQQGDIITVNFDKGIILTNTTSPTDFAVNILGIATTSITRHNYTAINLTLDSNIPPVLPLTLSYNQTTSNITNVNDLSLANFTNQPITNNVQFFDLSSLWDTRQKITINSNQITTTLQNFTLLVSISDSALNNSVCST